MEEILNKAAVAAIDLGAESCRISLLKTVDGAPCFHLVRRFQNGPIATDLGLMWDVDHMFDGIQDGLKECAALAPEGIASIGIDGWSVDYLRFGADGAVMGRPFCYRDERTIASMAAVHQRISSQRLYSLTGAQVLRFNTLYQLYADNLRGIPPESPWLNLSEYLLHRLGGRPVSEYTNATHTQMLGVRSRSWEPEVFSAAGLSLAAAPPVVMSGTDIGALHGPLTKMAPYRGTRLIAPACHDTASAVAGIPAEGEDWGFLISGTWSLIGTVVDRPYTGPESMAKNFTNQGGVGGCYYFLKNVNGMWMLRQSMSHWEREGTAWSVEELVNASSALPAPAHLLDVDDPDLVLPGDMPARINAQLLRRGLPALGRQAADAPHYANLIFHSLAARYRQILDDIAGITGKKLTRVYIVGGGARNLRMKRLVEEATGLNIILGSAESSTIGNFAIQLAALEHPAGAAGVRAGAVARWAARLAQAGC